VASLAQGLHDELDRAQIILVLDRRGARNGSRAKSTGPQTGNARLVSEPESRTRARGRKIGEPTNDVLVLTPPRWP